MDNTSARHAIACVMVMRHKDNLYLMRFSERFSVEPRKVSPTESYKTRFLVLAYLLLTAHRREWEMYKDSFISPYKMLCPSGLISELVKFVNDNMEKLSSMEASHIVKTVGNNGGILVKVPSPREVKVNGADVVPIGFVGRNGNVTRSDRVIEKILDNLPWCEIRPYGVKM